MLISVRAAEMPWLSTESRRAVLALCLSSWAKYPHQHHGEIKELEVDTWPFSHPQLLKVNEKEDFLKLEVKKDKGE